jgi:hypothetical protein
MDWLRWYLIGWLWPGRLASRGVCANRAWHVVKRGPIEATLIFRDTRQPDDYSREELVAMLETVRRHEKLQGWRVPEPTDV